ncbi:MAG TPA: hypothetical protein DCG30_04655 [Ruminococcus sp.]|nr:hypothetical protein [Ruminococcus sp.]
MDSNKLPVKPDWLTDAPILILMMISEKSHWTAISTLNVQMQKQQRIYLQSMVFYDNLKMMIICVFFCCKQSVKK